MLKVFTIVGGVLGALGADGLVMTWWRSHAACATHMDVLGNQQTCSMASKAYMVSWGLIGGMVLVVISLVVSIALSSNKDSEDEHPATTVV